MASNYYGDGGRLKGKPKSILIETAYAHDCEDGHILLDGLIKANLAHALMLIDEGIIPTDEGTKLLEGLVELTKRPASNFHFNPELGDVYNSLDHELKALIGSASGWLHVGRPRREAVNIGYLLAVRDRVFILAESLLNLARSLIDLSERERETISPDFTYLLHAQPTNLGHYLTTFLFPIFRDLERLGAYFSRHNQSPAGSGSVNGSSLPMNRDSLAKYLGFDKPLEHSRDGMWQTDLPMELMAITSTCLVNINRLAEELQIWNTAEFGTVVLPDTLCRASVIMPQKKNPYPLAYVRGVTGSLLSQFSSFASYGKIASGNPDSRIFIYGELPRAMDKAVGALDLMSSVLEGIEFNEEKLRDRIVNSHAFATDLADYLTYHKKIDYRTSHDICGRLVRTMLDQDLYSSDLTKKMIEESAKAFLEKPLKISEEVVENLRNPEKIVESRRTAGGAGKAPLDEIFARAHEKIEVFSTWAQTHNDGSWYDALIAGVNKHTLPQTSFCEQILATAKTYPDKMAIIEGSERQFTYSQILNYSAKLCKIFDQKPGQRIAILADDKPTIFASILAVQLAGCVSVAIDAKVIDQINFMIGDISPALLVMDEYAAKNYDKSELKLKGAKVLTLPQIDEFDDDLSVADIALPKRSDDDPAHIFYTSGTTGQRKGVVVTHGAYPVPAHMLNRAMGYVNNDVVEYVTGNIAHAFPFGRVRAILFNGGTAVLNNGKVMPQKLLKAVAEHNCNAIGAPASVVLMLAERFEAKLLEVSDKIKWVKMGTQAIPPKMKPKLKKFFRNASVYQQYGTSECPRTVFNDLRLAADDKATGRAIFGYKVTIRDEKGGLVYKPGKIGRVWISGPHVATEYWQHVEKTADHFKNGWFLTDDLGQLDSDGHLTLHGRQDEVINFGGQKLHPTDLENQLKSHLPDEKFIIFGINDPQNLVSEVPAIVRESNSAGNKLEKDAEWPALRLKIIKSSKTPLQFLPKVGFVIDEIPFTGSGKPKRKVLTKWTTEG